MQEAAQVAHVVNYQLFKGRRLAVILEVAYVQGCRHILFSVPGSRQYVVARSLRIKDVQEDTQVLERKKGGNFRRFM